MAATLTKSVEGVGQEDGKAQKTLNDGGSKVKVMNDGKARLWVRQVLLGISLMSLVTVCSNPARSGQVKPPKRESRLRHLFNSHREVEDLAVRYQALSCALVVIQSGNSIGTGFYISPNGDVVTALHVIGTKTYQALPDGTFTINLISPPSMVIRNSQEQMSVPVSNLETNGDAWGADIVRIKTGSRPPCWLRMADDTKTIAGQHVLTLGFSALEFESLTMYTGIISAKLKNDLVIGATADGQALKSTVDYIRVQMPISTGTSGSPVIDDKNQVIAVVTQAGAWSSDLDLLIQVQRMRETADPSVPSNPLDVSSTMAHLAQVIHDFASPGYGDAVPLRYLETLPPPAPSTNHHGLVRVGNLDLGQSYNGADRNTSTVSIIGSDGVRY